MSVRAFSLVPVTERGDLPPADAVVSLERSGERLYAGAASGMLHRLAMPEGAARARLVCSRPAPPMPQAGSATCLRAASALGHLLVLWADGCLRVVDMDALGDAAVSGAARLRGVAAFCLNENPVGTEAFCVQLCVASMKRKVVQIYLVRGDRIQPLRDLATPELPVAVAADGAFVCVAMTTRYVMLNSSTGACQELFPREQEEEEDETEGSGGTTAPIVKRIAKEEFLLTGPGSLGMFVTSEGVSRRAPVRWGDGVRGAALAPPYLLALGAQLLTVHSLLDQQLKQSIPFTGGHCLDSLEGKLLACAGGQLFALEPCSLESQVGDLLAGGRVDQALELARASRHTMPRDRYASLYERVKQQAGFVELALGRLPEATELFRSGRLDVRELASLVPDLLPPSSSFSRTHPPLHPHADLTTLTGGRPHLAASVRRFLASRLAEARSAGPPDSRAVVLIGGGGGALPSPPPPGPPGWREDVDTALVKLYAEEGDERLFDLLAGGDCAAHLQDSAAHLERLGRYFALGLLYHHHQQDDVALQYWVRVVDGELSDASRPDLFSFVVDFLSYCPSAKLVWRHSAWALQRSEETGVHIFTKRPWREEGEARGSEELCPDEVVRFLGQFPRALMAFLEHLVLERRVQEERHHTHLATLYLEDVLDILCNHQPDDHGGSPGFTAGSQGAKLAAARAKLQLMLQESELYRAEFLLGKLGASPLLAERALLQGRLGDHGGALHTLVHGAHDLPAARRYCSRHPDPAQRRRLFHLLLSACLVPPTGPCQSNGPERGAARNGTGAGPDDDGAYDGHDGARRAVETDAVAVADLLNGEAPEFEASAVLATLPEGWSAGLLAPFLRAALRGSLHARRTAQAQRGLACAQNLALRKEKASLCLRPVVLTERTICPMCQGVFSEPEFARYPSGAVVHPACARQRSVCPITGHVYSP
ncbi:transforming growth factor-beta receptor-associated protein 1-like [Lethenteron reissneri]|uniref:transforming growth factor-beta receptor-associated protein 1-like n=1 Tax=Lethenteron reissneri TaxID=7753 RepID=UPI002AB6815B|nr:transforming growth factor-beta receptor-associated protein 1-like [Lethenteron reissneri]